MVWSNWQGAIWRGAMVVLLFWSGLAWTQTPAPRSTPELAERIMVVHENGKSTRCRVMETWQLPDGRVAHLLQSLDSGEMITIVDEAGPTSETIKNPRAVPKRIFTWGQGRRSPPDGSPIPPHMRMDSGIVIKNAPLPPIDAVPTQGPIIVNRVVDEKALGGSFGSHSEGSITIVQTETPMRTHSSLLNRIFTKRETGSVKPNDPQIVEFHNPEPSLVIEQPLPPIPVPIQMAQGAPIIINEKSVPLPVPSVANPTVPTPASPLVIPSAEPIKPVVIAFVPTPVGTSVCDPKNPESCKQPEATEKKAWRPGANLQAWLQGKSTPAPKLESVKADDTKRPVKVETVKTEEIKNLQKADEHLTLQNKIAEKQLTEKIEKMYGAPFSTARGPNTPNEIKKPEASPLAIPSESVAKEKSVVLPPSTEGVKPITTVAGEKRDMWGNPLTTPIPPPGQTLLNPAALKLPAPPTARVNDPLMSPERLNPLDDTSRPKGLMLPPQAREQGVAPSYPIPGQPVNWPLGTQSVQAAHSGLSGTPMYIPVPTVTVPQPHNPPTPPAPKLPDPPQLNAYVNAFSPPPAPKNAPPQQPLPMQGMMPPQAMAAYNAPMMTQQQMMMQQQMMAQQQMLAQQQMMMQYGYRPNPALMNPYLPQQPMMGQGAPSQGPMANYSRQYVGPSAPNPFASNPSVQTGYAPTSYPAAMPAPMMMPQQPAMQPAAYQQQAMPTQQQAITQQVEQLIKVLRESPYPAQREWAAQSLTSFEWRAHPQIVPALLQSASQDPAASVRAGCVSCLGRMQAAVEPVFGTLQAMRNDIDPRVRSEVEQAFVRLGQSPMAPQ